jgi:hypothetical protein
VRKSAHSLHPWGFCSIACRQRVIAELYHSSGTLCMNLGEPLSGAGLVVARLAGGGLLALGIACWFARSTPAVPASLGVAGALLTYNVVACITLALALPPEPGSYALTLGATILHGLLAVGLLAALGARLRLAT